MNKTLCERITGAPRKDTWWDVYNRADMMGQMGAMNHLQSYMLKNIACNHIIDDYLRDMKRAEKEAEE